MDFRYVGYSQDRKLVKGKVTASGEEAALDLLSYSGYNVLSLEKVTPFFNAEKLSSAFSTINPHDMVMFSRQLALLVEAGADIVSALELLRGGLTNRTLKKIVAEVVVDLRSGLRLSQALEKHPKAFSPLYSRTIVTSEETGNLERGLRIMADYIERQTAAAKKIRNALIYPIIVLVLAVIVIAVLVTFVMPAFIGLYASLGVELPTITKVLIAVVNFLLDYGLFLLAAIAVVILVGFAYSRTPAGRYQWDKLKLRLPKIGRITLVSELSRCCRTISLLYRAGVSVPDIMTLAISGASNRVVSRALTEVREEMLKGQGLARPMSRNAIFLPMMVQMASVGEGTGSLDITMDTVAQSYEMEADDRTNMLISMITPTMTIIMGGLVAFIALTVVTTMYSMMGAVV
ncbi:MAG: type II secretion system F family protein [Chloroflexi bacterium]|nr:type II secretion system F family protein [Chloroflexota bacterium]